MLADKSTSAGRTHLYGRETIEEVFGTTHVWRGLFFAFDLQHVNNSGYNQVRGPVTVPGLRLHLEF